jgi:hypothetical protein
MIATRRIRRSPAPPSPENLTHGDAVRRGEHFGVVAVCARGRVLLWPVRWREAELATDVPVKNWADLHVFGDAKLAMVQAGLLLDLPQAGQQRLAQISSKLLAMIDRAAMRDAKTMQVMRRWQGEREFRRDECVPPSTAL